MQSLGVCRNYKVWLLLRQQSSRGPRDLAAGKSVSLGLTSCKYKVWLLLDGHPLDGVPFDFAQLASIRPGTTLVRLRARMRSRSKPPARRAAPIARRSAACLV